MSDFKSHSDKKTEKTGDSTTQESHESSLDSNIYEDVQASKVAEDLAQEANTFAADPQARMQAELEEWKARVAYLAAEVENMRKRFSREKIEIIRMANEDLLKRLLPVFDNLELASKAARDQMTKVEAQIKDSPVVDNLVKGVEMTFKHFEQTLESVGVKAIKTVGEVFNPVVHEAVSKSQDAKHADNTITNEFQKGFDFQGKILRPARVVVNSILQAVKGEADTKTPSTSDKETPSSN
jgi:molecular chaperone GrpE